MHTWKFQPFLLALCSILLASGCSDKKKDTPPPANTKPAQSAEPEKPKDPPVELKAKWEPGKRYLIREEISQESSRTLPNNPAPVEIKFISNRDFALTVLGQRPGGGYEIEVEFVASKVESKMGDKVAASFDSTSDPKTDRTNALAKLNRKIIGISFRYLTDAAGNIEKVEGLTNLIHKITAGIDRNSSTMLKSQYGEAQIRKLGVLPDGLPKQPVAPGDSWTNEFDMPVGGATAKFTVKSTLTGYEERESRHCAIIKNSGTATVNLGKTPAAANLTIENMKVEGETVFDPDKGQLVANNTTLSFEIKATVNGQAITQPSAIKSTKKLVEVTDAPKPAAAETKK